MEDGLRGSEAQYSSKVEIAMWEERGARCSGGRKKERVASFTGSTESNPESTVAPAD